METMAIEGHGKNNLADPINIKAELLDHKIVPDSSERDVESPDEGSGSFVNHDQDPLQHHALNIKDEPLEQDLEIASRSPSVTSDGDRQSGSGAYSSLLFF